MPDWAHIGYPIVECSFDGDFTVTKPAGTGGLVAPAVLAEQILYEIGDPSAYLLPDVTCDFTGVTLNAEGPDRVSVSGARGRAPTSTYKVCATYVDGFKLSAQLTIVGFDADAKARRTGEAILERTSELLSARGLPPYTETMIEMLGAESCYGPHARAGGTREAVLRLTATHRDKAALELLAREVAPAGTSWAPGTTGGGGRASASPSIRQYAFLLDKSRLQPRVLIDGRTLNVRVPAGTGAGRGGAARVRCALGRRRIRHGRDRASTDPRGLGPQRRQRAITRTSASSRGIPSCCRSFAASSRPSASHSTWRIWSAAPSRATKCQASTPSISFASRRSAAAA